MDRIRGADQDLRVPNLTQNRAKSHQSAFRHQRLGSESRLTVPKRQPKPNNSLSMAQEGAPQLIKAYSSSRIKQSSMEGITIKLRKRWQRSSFRSLIKLTLHRWTNIRTIRRVRGSDQISLRARHNHLSWKVAKHSSTNWIRSMNCQRVGEKPANNCSKFIRELKMQCSLHLSAKSELVLSNQQTSYASATTISNPSSRLVARSKGKYHP